MSPIVLGVRHHSPACARVVQDVIRRQSPAFVLIEGPVDYNERIDELLLGHQLPVAVFSFMHSAARSHASWSPLCDYSPEYVASSVKNREVASASERSTFLALPHSIDRLTSVRGLFGQTSTCSM